MKPREQAMTVQTKKAQHWYRRYIAFLLSLGMLVLIAATAGAQSAQEYLKNGDKLFATGNYQAAYEAYKKGHEIKPSPFFLRSMAFSLLKLFKHQQARDLLTEYLKKAPKAGDHQKIEKLIADLEIVVQTSLRVESTPTNAEIYIDAEAAGLVGHTPADLTIKPGKHLLILKAPGYHPTVQPLTIKPKENLTQKVILAVELNVTSTPPSASVYIDTFKSPSLGTTPLKTGVQPGRHRLLLKLAGYKTFEQEIEAKPGAPLDVKAALNIGLQIVTIPSGANIKIDGKAEAQKTPLEALVTPGQHSVVATLPGYIDHQQRIAIIVGQENKLAIKLKGFSALTMRTDKMRAAVSLGQSKIGRTPLTQVDVPSGNNTITVSAEGRRPWTQTLHFSKNELIEANLTLGRPLWPVWVAGGVTAVGLVLGTVGAVLAYSKTHSGENYFLEKSGESEECVGDCSYASHHLSTTGFITAGVSAAVGAAYYYFWARHRTAIKRHPAVP